MIEDRSSVNRLRLSGWGLCHLAQKGYGLNPVRRIPCGRPATEMMFPSYPNGTVYAACSMHADSMWPLFRDILETDKHAEWHTSRG